MKFPSILNKVIYTYGHADFYLQLKRHRRTARSCSESNGSWSKSFKKRIDFDRQDESGAAGDQKTKIFGTI